MLRKHILIVEDDDDIRETLTLLLEEHGYDVTAVGDGTRALDRLRSRPPPDLLVLDLMMPPLNGWEVMAALREEGLLGRVPIVITSATVDDLPLGASAVFAKPYDVEAFLRVVHHILSPEPEELHA